MKPLYPIIDSVWSFGDPASLRSFTSEIHFASELHFGDSLRFGASRRFGAHFGDSFRFGASLRRFASLRSFTSELSAEKLPFSASIYIVFLKICKSNNLGVVGYENFSWPFLNIIFQSIVQSMVHGPIQSPESTAYRISANTF